MNHPVESLAQHHWVKIICGASYHDLPTIRNLCLTYALAGADCLDVSIDSAAVRAAYAGVVAAKNLQPNLHLPLLMVSVADGADSHFRKATFTAADCPSTCFRPCQAVCPTEAIQFQGLPLGVMAPNCYGCGRCVAVCPSQLITTYGVRPDPEDSLALVGPMVTALEIHTQVGNDAAFCELWQRLRPWLPQWRVVSISVTDDPQLESYLRFLAAVLLQDTDAVIWQTDGRSMSGDLGDGTTHAALRLGKKVLDWHLPVGAVQLAGGTNRVTAAKMRSQGWSSHGIAYGGYARTLVEPFLKDCGSGPLEAHPLLLRQAVSIARDLVDQFKKVHFKSVHSA
ncbi:MAG: 4Fe-4S ferredoxin [Oscillatoriales cyanobacterium SM2_2_1]|nr:4Fe-4S ferredoxin [Oscillatoriales cyanobacterium SM2_2_1]